MSAVLIRARGEQAREKVRLVSKADDSVERHYVFGVVLEPDTVDRQGDYYTAETVEQACYVFNRKLMLKGQGDRQGHQHRKNKRFSPSQVLILESYVSPVDMDIEGQPVKRGTWLMRSEIVDPEVWLKVKSGQLTGYSIFGDAIEAFNDE